MSDKPTGSKKARSTSARLFAVQAVYQAQQLSVSPISLMDEYIKHNIGMDLNGGDKDQAEMVTPDGTLFKSILAGVTARMGDIHDVLKARLKDESEPEPLLKSIFLCGIYELLAHTDIDQPIIISDYVNIAHGFYSGGEPKLINAVLDATAKNLQIP